MPKRFENKAGKLSTNEKVKLLITNMINKTDKLKMRCESEVNLLQIEINKLEKLLKSVNEMDKGQCKAILNAITSERKTKLKQYKVEDKKQRLIKRQRNKQQHEERKKWRERNMNNTNNIDSNISNIDANTIFMTNALIIKCGRAVVVSLNDVPNLPGNVRNKHMTVLFRRYSKWTNQEIESIQKETQNWIKQEYGNNNNKLNKVTFSINNWGKRSVKIKGDLFRLCVDLRELFANLSSDTQRIPHVELFR